MVTEITKDLLENMKLAQSISFHGEMVTAVVQSEYQ
jgi:hypothetical protein